MNEHLKLRTVTVWIKRPERKMEKKGRAQICAVSTVEWPSAGVQHGVFLWKEQQSESVGLHQGRLAETTIGGSGEQREKHHTLVRIQRGASSTASTRPARLSGWEQSARSAESFYPRRGGLLCLHGDAKGNASKLVPCQSLHWDCPCSQRLLLKEVSHSHTLM